jgi:hypothetical protein
MDKRTALNVLIDNSFILTQVTKDKLKAMVEKMTDDEVVEWGKLLATEQTFVAENQEKILANIASL